MGETLIEQMRSRRHLLEIFSAFSMVPTPEGYENLMRAGADYMGAYDQSAIAEINCLSADEIKARTRAEARKFLAECKHLYQEFEVLLGDEQCNNQPN